jgi:hypothetical protein
MRLHSPEYWQARAEEARTLAESTRSVVGHDEMLAIADQYEELARRSERFAKNFADVEWIDEPCHRARANRGAQTQ